MGGGVSLAKREGGGKIAETRFRHGRPDLKKLPGNGGADITTVSPVFSMSKTSRCFLLVSALQETGEEVVRAEQKQQGIHKRVRWTFYNDSRRFTVSVSVTFLGATEDIYLAAGQQLEMERTRDGCLRVCATLKPLETMPFVQGSVGGYLLLCEVMK